MIHTYIHTHIHTYIHTYIHAAHIYRYIPTHRHTYINRYTTYMHTYMHTYVHTYIHTYIHKQVSSDGGETWDRHKCSGLLVSTGTGSTAWMAEATTLTPQVNNALLYSVCMHVYVASCLWRGWPYVRTYVCIYTYIRACMLTCIHKQWHTCKTPPHTHTYIHIQSTYTNGNVYIEHTYIHTHTYIEDPYNIYIYIHT